MAQQAALERQALEQLRRGDLEGARGTLGVLARLRPDDAQIQRRLAQVDELVERRAEAKARMQAEPLRYAHAYIKAGRLAEGLRLLRAALAKDPENERLRELALQVARRLRASESGAQSAPRAAERRAAEAALKKSARPTPTARAEAEPSSDPLLPAPARGATAVPAAAPQRTESIAPPGPPPPRFPPPRVRPAEPADVPFTTLDLADRLRTLWARVRERRRAPSRWLDPAPTSGSAPIPGSAPIFWVRSRARGWAQG